MIKAEFMEEFVDELTGLLVRGLGEDIAVRLVQGDQAKRDRMLGRIKRKREERAVDLLARMADWWITKQ